MVIGVDGAGDCEKLGLLLQQTVFYTCYENGTEWKRKWTKMERNGMESLRNGSDEK